MSTWKQRVREHNDRLVTRAKAGLDKNPDGAYDEDQLRAALAALLPRIDPDKAARDKAAKIIDDLAKVEDDNDDDPAQYSLALGADSYPYRPTRLVRDMRGNIIEIENATLPFILANLARSSENLSRVSKWNNRKAQEALHFQRWIEDEMAKSRPSRELTWGNCAKETGLIRAKQ